MAKQDKDSIVGALQAEVLSQAEATKIGLKGQAKRDYESENAQISVENRRAKQNFRVKWDKLLSRLVCIGFGSSYFIIFLIGIKKLSFGNSAFAVPSIVAIGIVQTYGLAKLAVSYFFSDDGEDKKR